MIHATAAPPRTRTRFAARLLFAAASCAPAVAACSAPATTTSGAGSGTFLSFVDPPGPDGILASPPRLSVSLGGRPGGRAVKAVMDTGSTGVAIAAASVPDWRTLPYLGPARIAYSSSGRVLEGSWVTARVTVAGGNDASVTTDPMPVMIVTRVACLPRARSCVPDGQPRHVAMLGIGFARLRDRQAQGTPDRNPFLRLAGAGRPGYVVTSRGVTAGLGDGDAEATFRTVRLDRPAGAPDWSAAPVCLRVAGHLPPACGTVLVDTGLSRGYLTVPRAQLDGVVEEHGGATMLRPGTEVALALGGAGAPWDHAFRAGDPADPAAPDGITPVASDDRPPFINTGVRFLNRFDYLYDAGQGLVGYRRRD